MFVYYCISFFIIGLYLGSLYNVIGYRLPKKDVIIYPSINDENNKINMIGLLPVICYFIMKYKYKKDISLINPIMELISGFLFLISYIIFGFNIYLLLSLTFISLLIIVVVSDYYHMIICDEILIIFGIILMIELFFIGGFNYLIKSIISGLISFIIMFLIKIIGDFLFKRESMGGGDIKLLFIFGLILGVPLSIFSIFLGSIMAFPISLIIIKSNSSHEIPFGPFLSMAAIILLYYGDLFIKLFINVLD